MSISPSGIHNKGSRIFTDGFGEGFRTMLYDDVTPSNLAREGGIETSGGILSALQSRNNDFGFKPRFTLLYFKIESLKTRQDSVRSVL